MAGLKPEPQRHCIRRRVAVSSHSQSQKSSCRHQHSPVDTTYPLPQQQGHSHHTRDRNAWSPSVCPKNQSQEGRGHLKLENKTKQQTTKKDQGSSRYLHVGVVKRAAMQQLSVSTEKPDPASHQRPSCGKVPVPGRHPKQAIQTSTEQEKNPLIPKVGLQISVKLVPSGALRENTSQAFSQLLLMASNHWPSSACGYSPGCPCSHMMLLLQLEFFPSFYISDAKPLPLHPSAPQQDYIPTVVPNMIISTGTRDRNANVYFGGNLSNT